jgi:hypothetical protein
VVTETGSIELTLVAEPSALALIGSGMLGFAFFRRPKSGV